VIVVREIFQAKPGQASKLAKVFKEAFGADARMRERARVMTDFVGPYNTVVMEMTFKDFPEFEQSINDYMARNDMREKMAGYTDLYQEGRREIYRVVE
jgi:hypothetical protein